MYVHLKFGENWTTNMGDMATSLFLQYIYVLVAIELGIYKCAGPWALICLFFQLIFCSNTIYNNYYKNIGFIN